MKQKYKQYWLSMVFLSALFLLHSCTEQERKKGYYPTEDTNDFENVASTDIAKARTITDKTIRAAESTGNDTLFLKGYYYRTLLDVNTGLTDRVIKDSELALKYSEKLNDEYYKYKIFSMLGKYYVLQNEFTVAMNYYLEARDYFEKNGDLANLSFTYNGLGILFFEMGNYDNCIANFNKAFDIYNKTGDKRGMGVFYGNMGNIYMVKEDYIKAKKYQQKSLETFKNLKDTVNIVSIMINLSNIESNLKNYDSSFKMLDDALTLSEIIKNKRLKERILLNYGVIYAATNEFNKAKAYFNEEIEVSRNINFPRGELDALSKLSEIAKKENKYKEYADYTIEYYKLKDSVFGNEVKQKIEELKWANEFEKSELERNLLKSKYYVEKERGNYLIFSIILTVFVSLLIIGLIWLFYRNNRKNLQISEFENEKLQESILREQISHEKDKAENELLKLRSEQQELELDTKNREITAISVQLIAKNKLMSEISEILQNSKNSKSNIETDLKSILFQNQNQEKDWEQFREIFEKIHPGFFERIKSVYPQLSNTDIRICAYIKIRMSLNEVAGLLNISLQSLHTSRYRIRKKLNLSPDQNLDDFIFKIQ
ncbi:tetratricopeptide repeat protein [Flavobacterium sp. NRK1]|uniref:tetratricopeptide repeat protein n=1 Tax=Flavobacterium sp. NRK1 TaxID=2954929 RepID=UPI002093FB7C|nr:tetratricopeptide repeat protein [Flavobacterium sp. NRK1]MCO6148910.1 tetratricopeptide repeat protein [Flavobacterium sp. NRK1]